MTPNLTPLGFREPSLRFVYPRFPDARVPGGVM